MSLGELLDTDPVRKTCSKVVDVPAHIQVHRSVLVISFPSSFNALKRGRSYHHGAVSSGSFAVVAVVCCRQRGHRWLEIH